MLLGWRLFMVYIKCSTSSLKWHFLLQSLWMLPDWNITPESAAGIAFINSLNWLNLVVKKKVVWIIFWSVEYVSGVEVFLSSLLFVDFITSIMEGLSCLVNWIIPKKNVGLPEIFTAILRGCPKIRQSLKCYFLSNLRGRLWLYFWNCLGFFLYF